MCSCNKLKYVLVLTISFLRCNANRPMSNVSIQNLLVTSSDVLANTVGPPTKLPTTIADFMETAYIDPVLNSLRDVIDNSDKFIRDYRSNENNEDATLNIEKLAFKYGYSMETHKVKTDDGYILGVHRIPKGGPVVFLMHGIFGSSDDFVIAGPANGFAYLLSNEGYDVWMGNARGNKHSFHHVQFNSSEPIFWDFSWHEIGYYDLPAMIDHALHTSNSSTLKYVGHSQGTTTFFVMASERKEYNKKVALMVALSPVAFMGKVRSPIARLMAPEMSVLYELLSSMGLYEFLPDNDSIKLFKDIVCGAGTTAEILCNNLILLFVGFDLAQLNVTNLPVLFGHSPSKVSVKQLVHYSQNIVAKDFNKYNYGKSQNLRHYRAAVPPRYALHRVSAPVSLFYSEADWLAHPDDVNRLHQKLPNAIDIYKVPYKNFSHLDFLFAKDVKILIYDRLRKLLSLFDSPN